QGDLGGRRGRLVGAGAEPRAHRHAGRDPDRHDLQAGGVVTLLLIRPDSWNLPLLLHVGGAMALVASVTVAAVALLQGWRTSDPAAASLKRFGARTLLYAAVPSYFVMR